MRYFKSGEQVFGYDDTNETQMPLIKAAIAAGQLEVTDSWPPKPTQEEVVAMCSQVVQGALDAAAKEWGYDSIVSAASYVASANNKFKSEALALISWRDSVWIWAEQQQTQLAAATLPPTPSEILAAMPAKPSRPSA